MNALGGAVVSDTGNSQGHSETRDNWLNLPEEMRAPFPKLVWDGDDDRFYRLSASQLREARTDYRYAIESFENNQRDRRIWCSLLNDDAVTARQLIQESCVHLRIDGPYHTRAQVARSNQAIMRRLRPTLDKLIELGIADIKQYARSGQLEDLRSGFVLLLPSIRLNPALIPEVELELSSFLQSCESDFVPSLLRTSFRAEGYAEHKITEGELQFMSMWAHDPEDELGQALGCHIAGYEARATTGWQLLKMHPRQATRFIRDRAPSLLQSVIVNTQGKCGDPSANAARLIARFWKMHIGLHAISRSPYKDLPKELAYKVNKIIEKVGIEARKAIARGELPKQNRLFNTFAGINKVLPKPATVSREEEPRVQSGRKELGRTV
jgi:hypothetical protein